VVFGLSVGRGPGLAAGGGDWREMGKNKNNLGLPSSRTLVRIRVTDSAGATCGPGRGRNMDTAATAARGIISNGILHIYIHLCPIYTGRRKKQPREETRKFAGSAVLVRFEFIFRIFFYFLLFSPFGEVSTHCWSVAVIYRVLYTTARFRKPVMEKRDIGPVPIKCV